MQSGHPLALQASEANRNNVFGLQLDSLEDAFEATSECCGRWQRSFDQGYHRIQPLNHDRQQQQEKGVGECCSLPWTSDAENRKERKRKKEKKGKN